MLIFVLQNMLKKAHAQHQDLGYAYQAEMLRLEQDRPWWSASMPVRTALQTLANTLYRSSSCLPACLAITPPVVCLYALPLFPPDVCLHTLPTHSQLHILCLHTPCDQSPHPASTVHRVTYCVCMPDQYSLQACHLPACGPYQQPVQGQACLFVYCQISYRCLHLACLYALPMLATESQLACDSSVHAHTSRAPARLLLHSQPFKGSMKSLASCTFRGCWTLLSPRVSPLSDVLQAKDSVHTQHHQHLPGCHPPYLPTRILSHHKAYQGTHGRACFSLPSD